MCPSQTPPRASARARPGRPKDESLQARRQEEILDVAAQLFADHGYADTDVDSVAKALSVAKGTIYRYFPSKRELFMAAVGRGMQRLQAEVEAAVAPVVDPLQRIERAIHTFLAYFNKHRELVELFIQERAHFGDSAPPAYFAHHEKNVGPWRKLYQQLVAAGRVRDLPGAHDHDVVSDLLYGTILANYFTNRRVPHKTQARKIVDIVFVGILTDAERQRRCAQSNN